MYNTFYLIWIHKAEDESAIKPFYHYSQQSSILSHPRLIPWPPLGLYSLIMTKGLFWSIFTSVAASPKLISHLSSSYPCQRQLQPLLYWHSLDIPWILSEYQHTLCFLIVWLVLYTEWQYIWQKCTRPRTLQPGWSLSGLVFHLTCFFACDEWFYPCQRVKRRDSGLYKLLNIICPL